MPTNSTLHPLPTLDRANQLWFRYQGRSMWPYFLDGDLLVVEPVAFTTLRRGDCIVFQAPTADQFIVHRVIATAPALLTKGDNRPAADDDLVTPDMLVGRVHTALRYARARHIHAGRAGRMSAWFHHQLGRLERSRRSRGGAAGRTIAWLLHPFATLLLGRAHLACFHRPAGAPVYYLMWRGRIIGVRESPVAPVTFLWPYSLLFGTHRE